MCRDIIAGNKPIFPDGYVPMTRQEAAVAQSSNPYENSNYMKKMKIRGGAFAILMAFHTAGSRHSMTRDQICRAAQPYCDEAMEANWHAGRPHGAWKGHETLQKHGLLGSDNKAKPFYNAHAGGFRCLGKNSYYLTREGELFIEALLKYKPEVKEIIQRTGAFVTPPRGSPRGGLFAYTSPPSSARSRGAVEDDRQRLMDWVKTAKVGEQIDFDVSKERRKSLHRLADGLSVDLASRGLQLAHESLGTGRARALTIRMEHCRTRVTAGFETPIKRPANIFDMTPDLTDDGFSSEPLSFTGAGRTLDSEYGTPPKRRKDVPAKAAAAEAALIRQAIFESTQDTKTNTSRSNSAKPGSKEKPFSLVEDEEGDDLDRKPKACPKPSRFITIDIDESDEDRKPSAQNDTPICSHAFIDDVSSKGFGTKRIGNKAQGILELIDSDEEDDLLKPIFKTSKRDSECQVVNATSETFQPTDPTNLQIFIDDRERSRNAQPRYLRMQLNDLVSSHIFKSIKPHLLKEITVIEKTITIGDFAFYVKSEKTDQGTNIPVCLERKRIGDLVQRSASKDHWRQLLRGQESSIANILLLEGDFRTAAAYEPFGAQSMDAWSPRRHVISDEPSLLRSVARTILSIHNMRLIQTKDEQDSLRAVAAYGTIAAFSSLADKSKEIPAFGSITKEKGRLADRLVKGGIPSDLANLVGEEVGSVEALERYYASGDCQECNENLLTPLLSSFCRRNGENVYSWSKAIHSVFFTPNSNVSEIKAIFNEYKHLAQDEGRLLTLLHRNVPIDRALDELYSSEQKESNDHNRIVRIEYSTALKDCFPEGNIEGAFYRLREIEVLKIKLPRIRLWTESKEFRSEFIHLNLIEGTMFIELVVETMAKHPDNSLQVAREVSKVIHSKLSDPRIKNVLIIRALRPALDRIAKEHGYRPETRLMVEMVCAELSLVHGLILFHAVRKNGDMEAFVREFALACFHYQFLTRKRDLIQI